MKKAVIFRTGIVLIFLVLALVPGCKEQSEITPVPPPTTPAPITPPAPAPTPVSPAEFRVSSISVTPAEIVAGDEATVSADVSNIGEAEGTYTAILQVSGVETEKKNVTLTGGEKTTVSFSVTEDASGTYTIDVGGQTVMLTVLKPAELEVSSLVVTPALVLPGQEAAVEADITNVGEVEGTLEAILKVNGVDTDSRVKSLPPGAIEKTSFTIIRDLPGTYELSIAGQSTTLTVPEVETYHSEVYNYSISYPEDWELDDSNLDSVGAVKVNIAGLGVDVDILPVAASLDELYNLKIDAFREGLSNFEVVSRDDVKKNGRVVGTEVIAEFTVESMRWELRLNLSKSGRYGFSVAGTSRESYNEHNQPLLDGCIQSFKPPEVAVGHYTDTTHGFSITLPDGWDGRETGENMPLMSIHASYENPPIFSYIYLEQLYEDIAASEQAQNIAAIWSDEVGYRVVSQQEVTLGEATGGHEVVFTHKENGYDIKRRVVSVLRGTQAFTLMVYTLSSTYDSEKNTIDQLVNSFTLEETRPFGVSRQDSLFQSWGDIVTLDPAQSEGSPGGIVGAIFSGLVRLDKDLEIVPDLAASWDVNDDGTVYTFHLRENATFHDGKPVTAHDFKYSWERACDPETESKKARLFLGDIVGAKEMLDGEADELSGVRVIDEHTLEVTIDSPKPYFLDKLVYITAYVVDRANIARGMNWTDNPNGTGPFKLKEWKKDELLILERNDDYYLEPARLEHIVFRIFAGRPMMMYEQGEIDTTGVGLNDLERVQDPEDPLNKELLTIHGINVSYLAFNVTMPPFDDPKVRRAFALALDMDKIIEVSMKGNSERAAGFLPPGIPGHNEALVPLPFDPEQALQLIADSASGSIDNLPTLTFYDIYALGPVAEAMIGMWQANLGISVETEIIEELEEYLERAHRREFQLFSSGWWADYIDPQNFLEILFHS
ncbi:MAG: hypothetical protein JSW16_02755, partial [Dehalococcoidales bacterium]